MKAKKNSSNAQNNHFSNGSDMSGGSRKRLSKADVNQAILKVRR